MDASWISRSHLWRSNCSNVSRRSSWSLNIPAMIHLHAESKHKDTDNVLVQNYIHNKQNLIDMTQVTDILSTSPYSTSLKARLNSECRFPNWSLCVKCQKWYRGNRVTLLQCIKTNAGPVRPSCNVYSFSRSCPKIKSRAREVFPAGLQRCYGCSFDAQEIVHTCHGMLCFFFFLFLEKKMPCPK